MPNNWVTVNGPADRNVYINGAYEAPSGKTGAAFPVEAGPNTFETLDARKRIDNRVKKTVKEGDLPCSVTLATVEPPEPTRVAAS
ncbi:MAG: hypothetical protein GY791_19715 [Alphaproteobacteria bacterium]|nr:hypothetical protein [Alphaproteobacteria bacterium]